ncbi:MAG TPA: hypothetical protein PKD73_09175 [Burkholderiaceae bacterium]|jgi:hypothetical protein|nr:hypothetical protein [Burkholderiaceae bacterium]
MIRAERPIQLAGWGALVLMLLAFCALGWVTLEPLRAAAEEEAQLRARLVGDELSAQLQRALDLGIPPDRLEGLQAVFDQRMRASPGIRSIELTDLQGRTLGATRTTTQDETTRMSLSIKRQGESVALLLVSWNPPRLTDWLPRWLLPLGAVAVVIAIVMREAVRRAVAAQWLRRESAVIAASRRLADGDFATVPLRLPRRIFDPRLPVLTEGLRHVNEWHMRVQRLVQSLRETEPDSERRAELAHVLDDAEGPDRFRTSSRDLEMASTAARRPAGWITRLAVLMLVIVPTLLLALWYVQGIGNAPMPESAITLGLAVETLVGLVILAWPPRMPHVA